MILLNIIFIFLFNINLLNYLYFFQLKGYFKTRYLKKIYKNKIFIINSILIIIFLTTKYIININKILYFSIILSFLLLITIINLYYLIKKKKIKFKYTFRIFRFLFIYNLFIFIYFIIIYFNYNFNHTFISIDNINALINFIILLSNPLLVILLDFLDIYRFFENICHKHRAKKYLENHNDILKIGITGSNGKTSIKNILKEYLSLKYKVITTPKNFNTPKGVLYTINKLCDEKTDCVIFEMGARTKGDISTLCNLCKVNYGIISNVSPQHIETFKSIDNVYKTKKELSDYINQNLCVFNFNNFYTRKMYKEKNGEKILVAVFDYKVLIKKRLKNLKIYSKIKKEKNTKKIKKNITPQQNGSIFYIKDYLKPEFFAKNIKIVDNLMHFDLYVQKNKYRLKTQLLGIHNINNILLSTALATKLGVSFKQIQTKTEQLTPIPHRLQLIKGRITILDDSYNCSLASAKTAIEVLEKFSGKKMICTPGIIEGGKLQNEINLELCKLIDKPNYLLVLVGHTNRKIFKAYFNNKKNVYYVDTLENAKQLFYLLNNNDTLLLLNDLPDDYK